jgi:hypothetical protein
MNNGSKPAYPTIDKMITMGVDQGLEMKDSGLTKREIFVKDAMQGMLSNPEIMNHSSGFPTPSVLIKYVDELLKALEP